VFLSITRFTDGKGRDVVLFHQIDYLHNDLNEDYFLRVKATPQKKNIDLLLVIASLNFSPITLRGRSLRERRHYLPRLGEKKMHFFKIYILSIATLT